MAVPTSEDDTEYVAHVSAVPVREVLRRFGQYLRRRPLAFVGMLALTAIMPLVETAEIWIFKIVVDDMLVPADFSLFPVIAGAYALLTVVSAMINYVDELLSTWFSQRFLIDLRADTFRRLQKLSPDFFERRRLGDLSSRLTSDIAAIESFLVGGATAFVSYLVRLVVFTIALFVLDWRLALVSLISAPLFWVTARYFSKLIKQASRERRRRSASISVVVEEALRNAALVQAYGGQEREEARLQRVGEGKYHAEMASARIRGLYSPIVSGIEMLGALVVIGYGTYRLSEGHLTVGGLLVFLALLSRLYSPLQGMSQLAASAYAAAASAERVMEVLDQRPSVVDPPDPLPAPEHPRSVQFRDVTFAYPESSRSAVDQVSFTVRRGESVALVGASGAGKTTLAKLLLRTQDVDSGSVEVDGIDIRALTLRDLRGMLAVVLQETLVFDGTVADNIAYGSPGLTPEAIEAAARAADAHDFITALPDGYASRVGERGARLSGGQRQRIAIARAMARDAPIVLMDEPTTGLDVESARRILSPALRLMENRATLIISHDLLLARHATHIVVLDGGQVVERGTHDDLVGRDGPYARLYRSSGLSQRVVSTA